MNNEYGLARSKSKKEIKAEQTKDFYKDITTALHETVGEYMAEQAVDDDEDDFEEYKIEIDRSIKELKRNQQEEVNERSSCDRQLMECCEKLSAQMSGGQSQLKQMLEQESRERISLQRQFERDCAQISEAVAASQRMQPRGFDELKSAVMRLEESQRTPPRWFDELKSTVVRLEENCKRMDVSIREDVKRTLQEDARTRSSTDQRLDTLQRSLKDHEQVYGRLDNLQCVLKEHEQFHERLMNDVRCAVQEQDKMRTVSERRFEERCEQLGNTVAAVEQAAQQPKALNEASRMMRWLEERCDRMDADIAQQKTASLKEHEPVYDRLDNLQRVLKEHEQFHERLMNDVRCAVQEQAQMRTASERRFEERCEQLGNTVAAVEQAAQQPKALNEASRMMRCLEERCDRMDAQIAQQQTASLEAVDNLKRVMQDDGRQRGSASMRLEERCDRLEAALDSMKSLMRMEERCDRLEAAVENVKSLQRDAVKTCICEQLKGPLMRLEKRCNTMDVSGEQNQATMSELAEEVTRLQQEFGRRQARERSVEDRCEQIQKQLMALQVAVAQAEAAPGSAPSTFSSAPTHSAPTYAAPSVASPTQQAAPTLDPRAESLPGLARGWSREERQFAPANVSDPLPSRQVSPPQRMAPPKQMSTQMAPPQVISLAPPMGGARGWSREENCPPSY